jgi:hypothetical protein
MAIARAEHCRYERQKGLEKTFWLVEPADKQEEYSQC